MIFFSLIAPKVRHVQTIDTKYTHGQYNQILFLNKRFCTLFAWKKQTEYTIQFLNKSSCVSSFQIAQLSAVKRLKKYIVMHVLGNNILTIQRLNGKRVKEFSLCKIHFPGFELRKQYKRGQVCSKHFEATLWYLPLCHDPIDFYVYLPFISLTLIHYFLFLTFPLPWSNELVISLHGKETSFSSCN